MYPSSQQIEDMYAFLTYGAGLIGTLIVLYLIKKCRCGEEEQVAVEQPLERAPTVRFFTASSHKRHVPTPAERLKKIGYTDEVPDYFCCNIAFDIMADPVLLQGEGRMYERKWIERWLSEKGNKGPFTNKTLEGDELKLISNLSLKSAIESFVTEKEEAFKALSLAPKPKA